MARMARPVDLEQSPQQSPLVEMVPTLSLVSDTTACMDMGGLPRQRHRDTTVRSPVLTEMIFANCCCFHSSSVLHQIAAPRNELLYALDTLNGNNQFAQGA